MTRSIPLDAAIAEAEKSGFLSIEDLQRLASPQPANPAQVTDAIRGIVEDALNSAIPEPWEVAEHATQRILAAIGAGGQAVPEGRWIYTSACPKYEGHTNRVRAYAGSIHAGWENSPEFESAEAFYEWAKAECRWRNAYEAKGRAALSQPHPADERVVEALATVEEWQKWALTWAGSAFLSGETISPDDMTETEYKSELYSGMCKLSNHMTWLRDEIAALSKQEPVVGDRKRIDDALVSCAGLIRALASDDIARVAAGELDYVRTAIGKESGWRPTHRHVRRGSEYEIIGQAQVQCSDGLTDYEVATVYRGKDGQLWVRRKSEFEDGRFEAIAAAPKQGAK